MSRWLVVALLAAGLFATVFVASLEERAATVNTDSGPLGIEDVVVPESRSFQLVMNTWPTDFTPEAIDQTYAFVDDHADVVGHHIDKGVPWPEAYSGHRFAPNVRQWLDDAARRLPDKPKYLAVSAISATRDGLNKYWGTGDHDPRPGAWKDRRFDSPEVIHAYVNYCDRLIKRFRPIHMVYGIEVNMLAEKDPATFERYVRMTANVYGQLKAKHPQLPLSLSFHVGSYAADKEAQQDALRRLLPYTDYLAVSSYPYMSISKNNFGPQHSSPDSIPASWFRDLRRLAPDKPFAIAETGFPAESFEIKWFDFPGTERWQSDYVRWLMQEADTLDAKFVMWFVPRDYDPLWARLEKLGMSEVFKLFRDTGLTDHQGTAREALRVWDAWRRVPTRSSANLDTPRIADGYRRTAE